MEIRASGLGVRSQHSPVPRVNVVASRRPDLFKRPVTAGPTFSQPSGRSAGGPRPSSLRPSPICIGRTGDAESPGGPRSSSMGHASIPSPLRRVGMVQQVKIAGEAYGEADFSDNDDMEIMLGERLPTDVWSPMSRPASAQKDALVPAPTFLLPICDRPGSKSGTSVRDALSPLGSPFGRMSPLGDGAVWKASGVHFGGLSDASPFRAALSEMEQPDLNYASPVRSVFGALEEPESPPRKSGWESLEANYSTPATRPSSAKFCIEECQWDGIGIRSPKVRLELSRQMLSQPSSAIGLKSPQTANASPKGTSPFTMSSSLSSLSTSSPRFASTPGFALGGTGEQLLPRPGTAILRSSHAERLTHIEEDRKIQPYLEQTEATNVAFMIQVLSFIRLKTLQMSISLIDFMSPYDGFRQGSITQSKFRCALEATNIFNELSDQEIEAASFLFRDRGEFSERIGQVHGPRRIQYLNFCFVIQPGERVDQSRRVALTDEQRHVMQALDDELQVQRGPAWGSAATRMVAEQLPGSPLLVNRFVQIGDERFRHVFLRVWKRLHIARASMRQYFGDFDARKRSTTKDTCTAGMNKGIGCLSRTQFERSMFNLFGLHEPLNEEDLAILFRKYEKSGEFNYFRFVRDLEEEQVCEIPVWPNAPPLGATGPGDIGVPEWGRGNSMDACTVEPVFTWKEVLRERDGTIFPRPLY